MPIIRKVVRPYGAKGAHITMPTRTIDADAIVFYDDDFERFSELIRNAYALSKLSDNKLSELERELKRFKDDITARVGFIERFLPSTLDMKESDSGNHSKSPSKESGKAQDSE